MSLIAVSALPLARRWPGRRSWWGFFALAALLGAFVYHPVRHFDFVVLDDPFVLSNNPWLAHGLSWPAVHWAFLANLTEYSEHAEYWSPLTLLSRLADAQCFGMNPGAFHVTSALLHFTNALLLAGALRLLTGKAARSAAVALLFLVHPLNVEPVCWLSARKDLLSGTFLFVTLLAYGWYARAPSRKRFGLVLAAYVCCLMSKPMGVSVPFLLLILDGWPLRRFAGPAGRSSAVRLLLEKVPFLLLAAGAAALAVKSQHDWGAVQDTGRLPMLLRVENAVYSYATYLRRLFWPDDLAIYYPHPGSSLSVAAVALSAALLVAITLLVLRFRREAPAALAGWLWFGIALGPVIGLMQVGSQGMADRYMYSGGIGLLMALVWVVAERFPRRLQEATGLAAVALAACLAARQTLTWRDSESVFNQALAVTTGNSVAHLSLGSVLANQHRFGEARVHLRRAVEISPTLVEGWEKLAQIEINSGNDRAAIKCYASALSYAPKKQEDMLMVAMLLQKVGDRAGAEKVLQHMQQLAPELGQSYALLARLYAGEGRWSEAAAQWNEYLRRHPENAEARLQLAGAQRAAANR